MAFQRKITISGCPSCLSGEAGKFDFVISVEDVGARVNPPFGSVIHRVRNSPAGPPARFSTVWFCNCWVPNFDS